MITVTLSCYCFHGKSGQNNPGHHYILIDADELIFCAKPFKGSVICESDVGPCRCRSNQSGARFRPRTRPDQVRLGQDFDTGSIQPGPGPNLGPKKGLPQLDVQRRR
eukprot:TRINITY_DN2892_c0_g3_i1.p1 TRINITY_DN2892_c0_g3~~TRINITY_DN2892_c0_g3_i1.p1  ORF type:complete len:107 (+),score=6.46 TRINITY_DN2892_c0_g3_i1:258-578(+)